MTKLPESGPCWIVIPNWAKYQNYKDRDPVWIKTYRDQLDDPAYLALTSHLRGLLHDLRLMFARHDGQVLLALDLSETSPKDGLKILNRNLNVAAKMVDLERLNHAGFIDFAASKPLALSKQRASAYRSTKEVREKKSSLAAGQVKSTPGDPYRFPCIECGVKVKTEREIRAHLDDVHWLEGDALDQAVAQAVRQAGGA